MGFHGFGAPGFSVPLVPNVGGSLYHGAYDAHYLYELLSSVPSLAHACIMRVGLKASATLLGLYLLCGFGGPMLYRAVDHIFQITAHQRVSVVSGIVAEPGREPASHAGDGIGRSRFPQVAFYHLSRALTLSLSWRLDGQAAAIRMRDKRLWTWYDYVMTNKFSSGNAKLKEFGRCRREPRKNTSTASELNIPDADLATSK